MFPREFFAIIAIFFFTSLTWAADREAPVTGKSGPGLEHFDTIMLETLKQYRVPGGALTIVKDRRLVWRVVAE